MELDAGLALGAARAFDREIADSAGAHGVLLVVVG